MPQYPPSSFESFVGNALQGYSMVKGIRRDAAEDRRREREAQAAEGAREIDRAVTLARMGREGIVPHDQVSTTQTPSASGIPSMRLQIGRRLGDTPYSQDLTRTPEAQARATEIRDERRRLEQIRPAIGLVRARVPELRDASDDEITAWLRNKDLREFMQQPKPRNIDPLSNEGIAAAALRERTIGPIRRQFDRPREGDDPANTLPSRQNDFADQYIDAAGGDPVRAQALAGRNQAQASRLGMTKEHYYGAATRFRQRQERATRGDAVDAAIAQILSAQPGK